MATTVKRMTQANVYLDNNSLIGKCEEVDAPDVMAIMVEHKALGMDKFELPAGLDKMEMRLKFNAFYGDILKLTANPYVSHNLQIRSSNETYVAGTRTVQAGVIWHVRGQFKKMPGGKYKQMDNVELETMLTVTRLKVEEAGQTLYEIDTMANIHIVDGVDIKAQYRNNLGIS